MIALFIALAKLLWHQFLDRDGLSSAQHGWEAAVQEQLQSLFSFYLGAISLRFHCSDLYQQLSGPIDGVFQSYEYCQDIAKLCGAPDTQQAESSPCVVISLPFGLPVRSQLDLTFDQGAVHASVATHAKVHMKLPEKTDKTKYPTDL